MREMFSFCASTGLWPALLASFYTMVESKQACRPVRLQNWVGHLPPA